MANAVGIITEYNPLHEGHIYHINQAKHLTGADCIVCVMSGNFVQRGEPAIFDKYTRTQAALRAGVNLVVELPVQYSTSSSEGFAYGATSILNSLQVSHLVFGSECGSIDKLQDISGIISDEPDIYKENLNIYLKNGDSFPTARSKAIINILGNDYNDILDKPNNILAIDYIKAIKKHQMALKAQTIKRSADNYNNTILNGIPSSSAIREALKNNTSNSVDIKNQYLNYVPDDKFHPLFLEDFSPIINYKIGELLYNGECLAEFLDVNDTLAHKITNNFDYNNNISSLIALCKSKDFTYLRIQRSLIHILLGLKKECINAPEYVRILGFDELGQQYLSSIKNDCDIQLITKPANANKQLSLTAFKHFCEDIYSTNLYNFVLGQKYNTPIENDYKKGPVIKNKQ